MSPQKHVRLSPRPSTSYAPYPSPTYTSAIAAAQHNVNVALGLVRDQFSSKFMINSISYSKNECVKSKMSIFVVFFSFIVQPNSYGGSSNSNMRSGSIAILSGNNNSSIHHSQSPHSSHQLQQVN